MRHIDTETTQEKIIFQTPGSRAQTFAVSKVLSSEIKRLLKQRLMETQRDWIAAEDVLPELKDPKTRAATMLRGSRYRENITQAALAKKLGIRPHHLSEMEHGKRVIGKEMAKKLASALKCDYRVFL